MALIVDWSVALLPLQFVVNVDANICFNGNHNQKETAENSPTDKTTIVTQVKVIVDNGAALTQREDKPPSDIDNLEGVDAVFDFLQDYIFMDPIDFAHDVENIDSDPD